MYVFKCTADFQFERPSYQYFLGDTISIEATVREFYHVPLRLFVQSCVATLAPDPSSNPRYAFIDNYGWGGLRSSLELSCRVTIDYHKHPACPPVILNVFLVFRCFVDARITSSASQFLPRSAENKLQLLLDAFRFQGIDSGVVSISKPNLSI